MYASRPRLVSAGCAARPAGSAPARRGRAGDLGRRRAPGTVERGEDRLLGDPVAALEVGRLGVQRRDRGERVGEVVEHQDEVGLDEGRHRDVDGVELRERDGRLERGDRVVGERPDGAAGEPRHPVDRQHPAARHERADRGEGIGGRRAVDRQVRGIGRDGDRPGLGPGDAVADLEEPPRPDAEERVPAEALAALDRLEEIGRTAVVEPQERPDRGLEVGRAGGAEQDRVRIGGEALRLRQAERVRRRHRGWPLESRNDQFVPGRKVVPSAVPPSFGDAALT